MTSEFFDFSDCENRNPRKAAPQLVEEIDEYNRRFRLADGRDIVVSFDDTFEYIHIFDNAQNKIGEFEFQVSEDEDHLMLTRAYMTLRDDSYKRQGIGRAAFKFFNESSPYPIYAQAHDGIKRDDGSHLTEDAPAFVAAMISEGLISE